MLKNNQIKKAIKQLSKNKIIIIPTDTIYGLSAVISEENEIRINELKKADISKKIIVLISNINQLNDLGLNVEILEMLNNIEPTTIISYSNLYKHKIAVRLVKRSDLKEIIDSTGPVLSTSVNIHNQQPINNLKEMKKFSKKVKIIYDQEPVSLIPSKIYDWEEKKWVR